MHMVEAMAFTGERPWHGLGNPLAPHQSIDVWRKQAGMDWEIGEAEVRYVTGSNNIGVINVFFMGKMGYDLPSVATPVSETFSPSSRPYPCCNRSNIAGSAGGRSQWLV